MIGGVPGPEHRVAGARRFGAAGEPLSFSFLMRWLASAPSEGKTLRTDQYHVDVRSSPLKERLRSCEKCIC